MRSIFSFLKQRDRVNGLSLPNALVQLIKEGRWVKPDWDFFRDCVDAQTASRRVAVLPAWKPDLDAWTTDPESVKPVADVFLYSLNEMRRETEGFVDKRGIVNGWIGEPDVSDPPGDIDPTRIIVIGDQGLGTDASIALDYRLSSDIPRVVAAHWDLTRKRRKADAKWSGYWGPHWREVAPNISRFAEILKL
jgi:hypothetical protein